MLHKHKKAFLQIYQWNYFMKNKFASTILVDKKSNGEPEWFFFFLRNLQTPQNSNSCEVKKKKNFPR